MGHPLPDADIGDDFFLLFYFLFPTRWITRIPFIIFYSISVYAMFLVSNIFNVGVEKSLQLYRAAFSVNYFYQSLMVFLFANLILSLKLNFFLGGLLFLSLDRLWPLTCSGASSLKCTGKSTWFIWGC